MKLIFEDRRKERSNQPEQALHYKLKYIKKTVRLEAVVLADKDGFIISHNGELDVCRELAALAPVFPGSIFGMPLPPNLMGGKIEVEPLQIDTEQLFLVYFTSNTGSCFADSLSNSSKSIQRILAMH